jgi:hypothetical protein
MAPSPGPVSDSDAKLENSKSVRSGLVGAGQSCRAVYFAWIGPNRRAATAHSVSVCPENSSQQSLIRHSLHARVEHP